MGNPVAIAVFLLFIVATLGITYWAARRTRTTADFYAAGSSIGGVWNGFAIAGDFMSGASILGLAGLLFIAGYDALYFVVAIAASWAVMLFVFAERLRNLGYYTFADVVTYRLQRVPMRTLSALATLAVAIPYLVAQMVAAGALVESLFGLSYLQGVVVVGVLMTLYVSFGGMLATTWVQIIKALLLFAGGLVLGSGILLAFDFNLSMLMDAAADAHPKGRDLFRPGGLYRDPVTVVSLALAFICGTAGLPHVLMRFFTVPDAREARRSAAVALTLIGLFQVVLLIVGLGAAAVLVDNLAYGSGGLNLHGGNNMAAIHLSHAVGGDVLLGFMSAVVFATVLAVVSGLTLAAASAVSHDLYAQVIRHGHATERGELRVSRITTVLVGAIAIALAIVCEGQNVAVLATLALAIAASANFPTLFLAMYWRGLTTRGAVVGGYVGLTLAVLLTVLGPSVWVSVLGFAEPVYPYAYPTLISLSAGMFCAWLFSRTDNRLRAAAELQAFDEQFVRSQIGAWRAGSAQRH